MIGVNVTESVLEAFICFILRDKSTFCQDQINQIRLPKSKFKVLMTANSVVGYTRPFNLT